QRVPRGRDWDAVHLPAQQLDRDRQRGHARPRAGHAGEGGPEDQPRSGQEGDRRHHREGMNALAQVRLTPRREWWGLVFVLPALLWKIGFNLIPMANAFYISLTSYDLLTPPR